MWLPGTVFPDVNNKWKIDIIDPNGTPLTLKGFDTPGKAKQTAREKAKELTGELKDLIARMVINQRRGLIVEEEAVGQDLNESADAIHAEMSLEKHLNRELDDLLGDEIDEIHNSARLDEAMDEDLRNEYRPRDGFSPNYIEAMRQMDDPTYDPENE